MKQAALLLRCSTDSQDYDRQLRDLLQVANDFNYEVPQSLIFGEYITGKDDVRKKERESITNLKKACKASKVDVILINEVSRLSRDPIAGRLFVREFNDDYKIPVYYRDLHLWTIDPETKVKNAMAETMLGFYFDAAAAELKSMKTRFASGKRKNARTGKTIGGVPALGYTKDVKGTLIIDEDKAKLVRIIFKKYLEKEGTITSVCAYMRGISDLKKWGIGTVGNILRNRAYTGKMEVSITNPDEQDETKSKEKYICNIPVIIDEDIFNKAQDKLDKNRTTQEYSRKEVHLLQKLIICSDCGRAFSSKSISSSSSFVYCCVSKQQGIECNQKLSVGAEKTETLIWNLVKTKLIELNKLGETEKQEKINAEKQQIQTYEEEIIALENSINKIIKKRKNLINFLEDAEEDEVDDIRARREKYKLEIEDSKKRISNIRDNISVCETNINQYINSSATNIVFDSIGTDRKKMKALIKSMIKSIIPYPIANSHCVLEVNSLFGKYYLLFSSRDKDGLAYLLDGSHHKFFPKDKKFLVLGNWDQNTIEKIEDAQKFAKTFDIIGFERRRNENSLEVKDIDLNKAIEEDKFYHLKKGDSIGVYTFNEMKERCRLANSVLSFKK